MMTDDTHIEMVNGKPVVLPGPGPEPINLKLYYEWVAEKKRVALGLNKTIHDVSAAELRFAANPEYILNEVIPMVKGGFILVYAPKGSYKSFFALLCAMMMLYKGQKVYYMAGEGHTGYKYRFQAMEKLYGTAFDPENFRITTQPYALSDLDWMDALKARINEYQPDLIIIDTLARHKGSRLKENDNDDMSEFVDLANELKMSGAPGCTVQVYHHTPADNESKPRGATALINAADTAISLSRSGTQLTAKLMFQKDGKDGTAQAFELKTVDFEDDGQTFTSGGLMFLSDPKIRNMSVDVGQAEIEILAFIGNSVNGEDGARFAEIKAYFDGRFTARQLYDMLSRIKSEGLIKPREGRKDPYIPTETGWMLIDEKVKN